MNKRMTNVDVILNIKQHRQNLFSAVKTQCMLIYDNKKHYVILVVSRFINELLRFYDLRVLPFVPLNLIGKKEADVHAGLQLYLNLYA